MKRERFFILACAFLLTVNCTGRAEQMGVKPPEPSSQPQVFDRSEGWKIIRALSKAYGDDSTMTGDFVGSTAVPRFWRVAILKGIRWSFRCGAIRCVHGKYWKRCREARPSVSK